jgi:acetyl-CoA synthetase
MRGVSGASPRLEKDFHAVKLVLSLDGPNDDTIGFTEELSRASSDFRPVDTSADDPAMMVLHLRHNRASERRAARAPCIDWAFSGVRDTSRFSSATGRSHLDAGRLEHGPAVCSTSCCLVCAILPVVARRFEKFDPEEAFGLMGAQIRNAFIPPTALRMLRAAPNPKGRYAINMRSIGSGGESLGAETYEWGKSAFGLVINEFYGQTECNIVLSA